MQKSNQKQLKHLKTLLSQTVEREKEEDKIEEVKSIFRALDIPNEMEKVIHFYSNKAIENLEATHLSEQQKKPLLNLLEKLMHREH